MQALFLLNIGSDKEHPDLVKKYLGSVVPVTDNYYATLNSAVFSEDYLSHILPVYDAQWNFRPISINAENTGNLTVATQSGQRQLGPILRVVPPLKRYSLGPHAAVVEIIVEEDAKNTLLFKIGFLVMKMEWRNI